MTYDLGGAPDAGTTSNATRLNEGTFRGTSITFFVMISVHTFDSQAAQACAERENNYA